MNPCITFTYDGKFIQSYIDEEFEERKQELTIIPRDLKDIKKGWYIQKKPTITLKKWEITVPISLLELFD
ncbi:hypothetical protein [Proteiniphilum sp. UBA5480]|jgi:hypothetical protein|uniref:hypothetical protein n=1 Tax=Proteiniphilum sp. UBA5480 TaxID=1947282 RepID=UPI002580B088|nr:hypothetical protein [Proteiniphilum sp. UBA5480]